MDEPTTEKRRGGWFLRLRDPHLRRYEREFSAQHWVWRQRRQNVAFWFGRRFFGLQTRWGYQRETFSVLRELGQALVGPFLLSLALVTGVLTVDHLLVSRPARFDPRTLTELLSVTAQIAGIFLGLYFTAVSVVASTAYARVPGEVRALLTREKAGDVYIRTVALLATVSALLLAGRALGFAPGVASLVLASILGVLAILSFVVLGVRTFHFFDPTRLVTYVARDLARWFAAATPTGFRWHDPSFQAHYQKQAERGLDVYGRMVQLVLAEKPLRGDTLAELAMRALTLWHHYGQKKVHIPSESLWFRRTPRHRDWLTTDYLEVDIALKTGTGLQPEPVPDPLWVESELAHVVTEVLEALVAEGDLRNAARIGAMAQEIQRSLGWQLALDEALLLHHRVARLLGAKARENPPRPGVSDEEDQRLSMVLALTDVSSAGLIELLLGIVDRLTKVTAESVGRLEERIAWGRTRRTVHAGNLPRDAVKQVEYLAPRLDFERSVEGETVSARWYRQQLLALGFARWIDEATKRLTEELVTAFPDQVEAVIKEKQFLLSAQLLQRGLEACHKFGVHLEALRSCSDRLAELRRVPDIPWPATDWDHAARTIEAARERLVVAFGRSAAALAALPRSTHWPDYFGQAYLVLAQECYTSLADGNEKVFAQLFPEYFRAALAAHDRLGQELSDRDPEVALVYSTESIEDLLDLSGYALLYSELDGQQTWTVVRETWDSFLAGLPEPRRITEFIAAVASYRRRLFALPPRALARTAWKQDFEARLRERGLLEDDYTPFGVRPTGLRHTSPVIRAFARGGGFLLRDAQDAFMAVYFMRRPEAADLEPDPQTADFQEDLEREEERVDPDEDDES